jgi:isopentenyl diphosphate isomerase/L-lactate dehydrogenase-like FMN-dependent dehydrogenase
MKLSRLFHNNIGLVIAVGGVAISAYLLSSQLNPSKDLLIKYGATIAGALVGVINTYIIIRIFQRISERGKKRVFISYNHQDSEFAMKLADSLKEIGVKPVMDRLELRVGDDIQSAIDKMIESSEFVIIIASANSQKSDWMYKESLQALKRQKKILPVALDPSAIPDDLKGIFYADFSKDYDAGIEQLTKSFPKAGRLKMFPLQRGN